MITVRDQLAIDWKAAWRFVPQLYFAPLTGAIRGIREEYRRLRAEEKVYRQALEREMLERARLRS